MSKKYDVEFFDRNGEVVYTRTLDRDDVIRRLIADAPIGVLDVESVTVDFADGSTICYTEAKKPTPEKVLDDFLATFGIYVGDSPGRKAIDLLVDAGFTVETTPAPLVKEIDPELERLLAEEMEIERQVAARDEFIYLADEARGTCTTGTKNCVLYEGHNMGAPDVPERHVDMSEFVAAANSCGYRGVGVGIIQPGHVIIREGQRWNVEAVTRIQGEGVTLTISTGAPLDRWFDVMYPDDARVWIV